EPATRLRVVATIACFQFHMIDLLALNRRLSRRMFPPGSKNKKSLCVHQWHAEAVVTSMMDCPSRAMIGGEANSKPKGCQFELEFAGRPKFYRLGNGRG